jgi:hypothetical protein
MLWVAAELIIPCCGADPPAVGLSDDQLCSLLADRATTEVVVQTLGRPDLQHQDVVQFEFIYAPQFHGGRGCQEVHLYFDRDGVLTRVEEWANPRCEQRPIRIVDCGASDAG